MAKRDISLTIDQMMVVELHRNFVIINNITVPRPERIPPSYWLRWWEERT
jgi:hypothetical protein